MVRENLISRNMASALITVLEYSRIYKVGGVTFPCACMEWPGIQIPHALIILREDRFLLCPFSDVDGNANNNEIHFYDRNPAGKGLDFDACPDDEEPFLRYSVSFHLQDKAEYLSRLARPADLKDISRDLDIEMLWLYNAHTPTRKGIERLL